MKSFYHPKRVNLNFDAIKDELLTKAWRDYKILRRKFCSKIYHWL